MSKFKIIVVISTIILIASAMGLILCMIFHKEWLIPIFILIMLFSTLPTKLGTLIPYDEGKK